jgi:uncharacterized delta-60 repeat protein
LIFLFLLPPANPFVRLSLSMSIALLFRSFVRSARPLGLFLATLGCALVPARAQSASDGFAPEVDGTVFAVVAQPDGKLLVAGQFATVNGIARANLARLNTDGSVDAGFNPSPNAPVRALALQRDGRIVFGGDFRTLQPGGAGATVTRGRLARLNADGSVDTGFSPAFDGQLQPQVHAVLVQPDGRIVVGGSFTRVQPAGAATPFTRNYVARLNADGSLDQAFDPSPNGFVLALVNHVDNKIVLGGGFTSLWPAGQAAASDRNRLARLNANGSLDSEFNPNANNGVTCLAVQRDGKILVGGAFTTLQPPNDESASNRSRLARLNVDGTLDSEFYPRADGSVASVVVQPDGSILFGGTFTSVWGRGATSASRNYVARLLPDATLDSGFAPALNGTVNAVAVQPDGRIVLGGAFTRATPAGATVPIERAHLARLNANGSFDSSFELGEGGRPLVSVTQADGKVIIGGSFTSVGGVPRTYLARLNADGTLDTTYKPEFNERVFTLALQSDGKLLVGGAFTTINGERRERLARLNPSGTTDSEFYPHFDGQVGTLVLLADGKMLVGGTFSSLTPVRGNEAKFYSNLVRLNADGTLDTAFDPNPNSTVAALVLQSDGKILVGGVFSAFRPKANSDTNASFVSRSFIARLNADGTLDSAFDPTPNGQISTLALQSDGKVILGGAFTSIVGSDDKLETVTNENGSTSSVAPTRNRLARLNPDGTLDATYNPNANGNVLVSALQSDGRLIIGGSFTTLTPNGAPDWTLRKYAARLNADGTVDATFNLDVSEAPGNRVDSLRLLANGVLYVGGAFTSLRPIGTAAPVARRNFARLTAAGQVDAGFDPNAGGITGAAVNALALQADGGVIAVGSFSDLGGAKSTNVARFRPEGTPDPDFSSVLSTDGPVNAVVVRPAGEPVPTQLGGFAWLNANGTLRSAFAAAATRLSGEITAVAVDRSGRLLLGGTFANVSGTTGSNLVRFSANGALDTSFNPRPNGTVTGIAVQTDGRILVVGNFTTIGDTARNRLARIDDNGALDITYDPSANGSISALVLQDDGKAVIGGAFTSFTPNLTTTAVARNYLARVNVDGTIDANYNPSPNFNVNALALQADGKVVAGGGFTSVAPNGATTAVVRNYLARFNTDGTLDQNFDPNANSTVDTLAPLANGQFYIGGTFTSLQPNATGTVYVRNYLARINSDGVLDQAFNPNPNGAVKTLAVQANGAVLVGGSFTTLQPNATGTQVARNRLARIAADGTLDLDFNPDIRGTISVVAARPDGTMLVGGSFTDLQVTGSILIGGSFASAGGVGARNLAMLNDNGSVTATFQPRPDGAVHALAALPDGRTLVGGAFTNIAGTARRYLARFTAEGGLDTSFNADPGGTVMALALQSDGKVLAGVASGSGSPARRVVRFNADGSLDGSFTGPASAAGAAEQVVGLAVQADGRILMLSRVQITGNASFGLGRLNANGSADSSFAAVNLPISTSRPALAVQADGRILLAGAFTSVGGQAIANLARLNADGTVDTSFAPAPDGAVTALALQEDGRLMIGGGFRAVRGAIRPGIARLSGLGDAAQTLGVAANRGSIILSRTGAIGEISSVIFEQSVDRTVWTTLGTGVRAAGSANWQIAGLNLPASGLFYVRARSLASATGGVSAGMYETVREFNYSSPVPGLGIPATITTAPALAASQVLIDAATGIIPRSVLTTVPGEGTVEIIVQGAAQASAAGPARLANLSTRGRVAAGNSLVLGFAISGPESRRVLVRGVGPALGAFGVTGAIASPRLQVHRSSGEELARVEGWGNAAEVAQVAVVTGAFPLAAGSADSAAVLTLAPGNYTIQVSDARGSAGVALAEIYDAGSGAGSRLVNVSSLGSAGSGSEALISGFVLDGGASARVLLRGVGPGLTQFGAADAVTNPLVALYDSTGQALGANDNWVSSVGDIAAAALRAGAFPLAPGSKDAAVLATLPAGVYTVQVSSDSTAPAAALLEVYEVR